MPSDKCRLHNDRASVFLRCQPISFAESASNGLAFYQMLQLDDGHWGCSYGGPSFLLSGIVFAMYITGKSIPLEWQIEMTRYICNHINDDGGWGLHTEGTTTVFATVLYYVTLRILGIESTHETAVNARERLHALGGTLGTPQWGRYWLSCLNLYDWDGVQPVPAEMWILPDWVPFHPWRWWVQCRSVYLPVSYLYANKCRVPLNSLLRSLRKEIYLGAYENIQFSSNISRVAPTDTRVPLNLFLKTANAFMRIWEKHLRPVSVHDRANHFVRHLMRLEDENTSYSDIAPVNKALHMVAVYFCNGPDSAAVKRHHENILPYLWQGADGMNRGGTNGTQLWDTAFSVIAVFEAGLSRNPSYRPMLERAHKFLDETQFRDNLSDPYRQQRKGGWPFGTKDQGYVVSDCTAEAMKAIMLWQEKKRLPPLVSASRLQDCVDTLLAMQNPDKGFGSYERARTGTYVELLNPAEIFDRCMVEYSYTECTTAVLTGLSIFRTRFPAYRSANVRRAIENAASFVRRMQRPDGSWFGSWGVCFTYGTFFALESLAVGETYASSERVRRACDWLKRRQMDDGGWGEDPITCEQRECVSHVRSQVVNTAWATLGLMAARYPDRKVVERGLELIKSRQLPNGEWLQEGLEGVFNCTCMIEYPNYKFHFSIRALGYYEYHYLPTLRTTAGL